jgi:hypothetical protein
MNQDKIIIEIADKIVSLYTNKDIINYKSSGKQLTGKYGILTGRQISGIYSNIKGKQSINIVLTNAIKFSLHSSIKAQASTELTELSEVYERTKIALRLQEKKKTQENTTKYDEEIKKKQDIISILETKINIINSEIEEIPQYNKIILANAEQAYEYLLRGDFYSKEIYILVCNKLGVNLNIAEHFGYETQKFNNYNNYNNHNNHNNHKFNNYKHKEKDSSYVPPALRK